MPTVAKYIMEIAVISTTLVQSCLVIAATVGIINVQLDWFNQATNIETGTGGMTRAAIFLYHGDIKTSLLMNPFLIPFVGFVALTNFMCIRNIITKTKYSLNDYGIALLIILALATIYRNFIRNII